MKNKFIIIVSVEFRAIQNNSKVQDTISYFVFFSCPVIKYYRRKGFGMVTSFKITYKFAPVFVGHGTPKPGS